MDEPNPLYRFGNLWRTRPSGLYVPEGHDDAPTGVAPAEERHKVTDWLQGIGTMVAAVIAAFALLVGAQTLQDQQQINRDQMALNQDARDRAKRRYVSRVTWWPESSKYGQVLVVQNRAPIPLLDVSLSSTAVLEDAKEPAMLRTLDGEVIFWGTDVPPCSVARFRPTLSSLPPIAGAIPSDVREWAGLKGISVLRFRDFLGEWELPQGGPAHPAGQHRGYMRVGFLAQDVSAQRDLSDCGESA